MYFSQRSTLLCIVVSLVQFLHKILYTTQVFGRFQSRQCSFQDTYLRSVGVTFKVHCRAQ